MLAIAKHGVKFAIFALIAARVFTGQAVADEAKPSCAEYSKAVATIMVNAADAGAYLTFVPVNAMDRFKKLMHAKGQDIEGDSAVIWIGPAPSPNQKTNLIAVYVKRGKQLCIGVSAAASADGERKPSHPGSEWF